MATQKPMDPNDFTVAGRPYLMAWTYPTGYNSVAMIILDPDDHSRLTRNLSDMSPLQRAVLRAYLEAALDMVNHASRTTRIDGARAST